MGDHPNPCVECEEMQAPTEGMTKRCEMRACAANICLGHMTLHMERVHGYKKKEDPCTTGECDCAMH